MIKKNRTILAAILGAAILGISGCSTMGEMALTDEPAAAETDSTQAATEAEKDSEEAAGSEESEEEAKEASTEEDAADAAEKDAAGEASTEESAEEKTDATAAITGKHTRRKLPKEAEKPAEEAAAEDATTADETVYPASLDEVVPAGKVSGGSVMFVESKKVKDTLVSSKKDDSYPDSEQDVDKILSDLGSYWQDYNLEAVDYLVRMEKYQYLSGLLDGSDDYFYCGEENADGEPNGTGIAVYAGNQYYYGSFKDGLREGQGFWYQIFVKDGPYSKANNGIYGHSYNGEWKNDLPDGKGQEHLDIDSNYLTGRIVTNVIGSFAGGYYHGDQVVVTMDASEGQINWRGEAVYGTWKPYGVQESDDKGEIAILQNTDNDGNYFWIKAKENHGQGVNTLLPAAVK